MTNTSIINTITQLTKSDLDLYFPQLIDRLERGLHSHSLSGGLGVWGSGTQ